MRRVYILQTTLPICKTPLSLAKPPVPAATFKKALGKGIFGTVCEAMIGIWKR